MAEYPYLEKNRLSDVIRLIAILAKEQKYAYRTEDGLKTALNGPPKSANDWFALAAEHPEFFKFNQKRSTIILLMRFLNEEENDATGVLSIDQTQKLIDQAIALHDRQIIRYQRNSFRIPLWTSIIAALVAITVASITFVSNSSLKGELQRVAKKLENVDKKLP